VVSQTPTDENATSDYLQGWESLTRMILHENASWSGRERNNVYLNLRDGTFADVSAVSGANSIEDGRALAVVDWNDDGRQDLVLRNRTAPRIQLFVNQDTSDAHFLALDLRGTTCNRDAIGARVTVEVDGRTLVQTLKAGDGFMAQSSKRLHFGLGSATSAERVTVRWPDGSSQLHAGLAADTRYALVQGEAEATVVPRRIERGKALLRAAPAEHDTRSIPRLELLEKLPLAPVGIPAFDDPEREVRDLAGGPVLLNLWSTTWAACLGELAEFRDQRTALEGAGLRIATLAIDAGTARERVDEILAEYGLEEDAGYVDAPLLGFLEIVFAQLVGSRQDTPLPTSLLLDEEGQLVAVYFGPVETYQLLSDVTALERMKTGDLSDVKLTPGRWLAKPRRPYTVFIRELREAGLDELAGFYRRTSKKR
jgi:hypothetical protein